MKPIVLIVSAGLLASGCAAITGGAADGPSLQAQNDQPRTVVDDSRFLNADDFRQDSDGGSAESE